MPTAFGNSGAYGADNVYVVVKPPQPVLASGGATFSGMAVGGGQWGPLGVALNCPTPNDVQANYGGPLANNPAPLVQESALFLAQQPLGGLKCVRVGDGTQAAATGNILDSAGTPATGLAITGLYTGTFGNGIKVSLVEASDYTSGTPSWKIIVQAGTFAPEVYDKIKGTGSALWIALANAINNGLGPAAPASKFVTAAVAASSAAPPTAGQTITLSGGLDGVSGLTGTMLVGTDGTAGSRTGMYALRKAGGDVVWLAGCTDSATWAALLAFAKSENCLAIGSLPKNTTPTAAVAAKLAASAIDDPYMAVVVNHVVYFDTILNQYVYAAPACVLAGVCCSLDAHESPGNKAVLGIVGTDKTFGPNPQALSDQDDANLEDVGITSISNNLPGTTAFGIRNGKNTSSNTATNEMAWTRKTNDLVRAFAGKVMGQFVDLPQGTSSGDEVREHVRSAFNAFLGPQVGSKIDGFYAQCDLNNNPAARIKAGYLQADVQVAYLAIVNKFVINLVAGQSVSVNVQGAVPQQI